MLTFCNDVQNDDALYREYQKYIIHILFGTKMHMKKIMICV